MKRVFSFFSNFPKSAVARTAFFAFPVLLVPVLEFAVHGRVRESFAPFSGEIGAFAATYLWILSLLALSVSVF